MWQRRPSGPARPVWVRTAAPGPFSQVAVCPEGVRCRRSFGTVWSCSRSSDCTPDLWENRWNIAHVSENTHTLHTLPDFPAHFPSSGFPFSSLNAFILQPTKFYFKTKRLFVRNRCSLIILNDFIFTKSFRKQEQKPDICADRFCVFQIYAGISKCFDFIFVDMIFPKKSQPVSQWCTEMITDTIKTIVRKLHFKWTFIHWSNARQSHFQFILVNIYIMWKGWIKTNGWLQSYSLLTAQCRRVGPCAGRTAGVCDAPSSHLSLAVILLEGQITGMNGDIWLNTDASEQNHHPSMGLIFRQK